MVSNKNNAASIGAPFGISAFALFVAVGLLVPEVRAQDVAKPPQTSDAQSEGGVRTSETSDAKPQEVIKTPETEVVGHYETAVGTTDAASEGSVTYKRIQSRPLQRAGEVIELVPGMVVTQHSGDGKANQYFLRGYNLDHGTDFAIWVDGMPVNNPTHAHGQGYADINFMIPELVQSMDFRKGPYFAEEGDFSSVGAAHIHYFDVLPQNVGLVTLGTDHYGRVLAAASPELGGGHLLIATEAVGYDGPWVVPEDFKKFNGVLRYSEGGPKEGYNVSLMGYGAKWNSTDQVPQYAVDNGYIPTYGAIDPTDGGQTERYSLSFGGRTPLWSGQGQLDAYIIKYNLDLWSNFTYFLDNATRGDQFQQSDRRMVYGLIPSYTWANKLGSAEMTNTVGIQIRYDDIDRVALYSTQGRQIWSVTSQNKVGELAAGIYGQNATQWNSWFRSLIGLRYDFYNFNVDSTVPANSGVVNAGIASPKVSLIFGPWSKTEYFVNWGYGFHSNDARGTTLTVDPRTGLPVDGEGNPIQQVDPLVRTQGAELGLRTEIIPRLQSSLALWVLKQDSELLFTGDAGTTEPSRPSQREGIEWINYYKATSWLLLDAELALTKARFTDSDPAGDYIPGAVESVFTFAATVDNIGKWFGTLQVVYFGARPLIEDNSVRSSVYAVTNLRVGYKVTPKVRMQLDVFNLFDRANNDIEYYYESFIPGVIPAPQNSIHFHPAEPRQFRFTVVANF